MCFVDALFSAGFGGCRDGSQLAARKQNSTVPQLTTFAALDPIKSRTAALAGIYLMGFYNVPWVLCLSLVTSNTAGTTKKAFCSVSVAIAYAV